MKDRFYPSGEHQNEVLYALAETPGITGGERIRAEFCRDFLLKAGYAPSQLEIDGSDTLILKYDIREGKDNIAFSAHLDTVFPAEENFTVRERDGKLFCPGIGDNSANAAGLLLFAEYLLKNDIRPGKGIFMAWTSGEEGLGNLRGCRSFMQKYAGSIDSFAALDLYYDSVFAACIGSVRYKITVKTQGGHSYLNFGRKNAIVELARMISEIEACGDFKADGLTRNAGVISGGRSVNSIADSAELLFEFRSSSDGAMTAADTALKELVASYNAGDCSAVIETLGLRPCGIETDPVITAELTSAAQSAITAAGFPEAKLAAASTDCNIPLSMGIPSTCFGLCMGGGAHTRGEWTEKNSNLAGFEILRRFAENFIGV